MQSYIRILACLFIISISSTFAQNITLKVWPIKIPDAIADSTIKEEAFLPNNGPEMTKNVIDPTITVYFPKNERANGLACIICPGGGYASLALSHEGREIAAWLNEFGVTAILLKYRLPNSATMKNKSIGPLQDVQEALRISRRNALKWKINPHKIGIIGFSAGGHLVATLSTHYNDKIYDTDTVSARPDFAILVYPVITMNKDITHIGSRNSLIGKNPSPELIDYFSNELHTNNNTPPTFLIHCASDQVVPVQNSINYFLALKKFNVPCELHIYEKGGHGFGLAKNGGTESMWPEECKLWLKLREFQ
jgi:acetyl esterase/lipase